MQVYLQLNRQMVKQVSMFEGCGDDFYYAVVMKLQPSICTAVRTLTASLFARAHLHKLVADVKQHC